MVWPVAESMRLFREEVESPLDRFLALTFNYSSFILPFYARSRLLLSRRRRLHNATNDTDDL
jgi:hypothetical protein